MKTYQHGHNNTSSWTLKLPSPLHLHRQTHEPQSSGCFLANSEQELQKTLIHLNETFPNPNAVRWRFGERESHGGRDRLRSLPGTVHTPHGDEIAGARQTPILVETRPKVRQGERKESFDGNHAANILRSRLLGFGGESSPRWFRRSLEVPVLRSTPNPLPIRAGSHGWG